MTVVVQKSLPVNPNRPWEIGLILVKLHHPIDYTKMLQRGHFDSHDLNHIIKLVVTNSAKIHKNTFSRQCVFGTMVGHFWNSTYC